MIETVEWPSLFGRDLGMDASHEELRGVGVPQVVETDVSDLGLLDDPPPLTCPHNRYHFLC